MKLITLHYRSTNYYLIGLDQGWLMVDVGWPGTFKEFRYLLARRDIGAPEIRYLVATHFHPDHAGLVEEFKEAGAQLIVHKVQSPFVDRLPALCKPADHFTAITPRNTIVVSSAESRQLLHTLGVTGEILPTPGHSADSVSLVVDGCCAFTGDLPSLHTIDAESNPVAWRSWQQLRRFAVQTIYPAHGQPFLLEVRREHSG